MGPETLYGMALIAVPILLSLTLHEYGHARVALAFGDRTAKDLGRVTLNPLAHLDLIGTICLLVGPIGWAKPVPVDFSRLRPARIGDICVSLAGVGMNLLLAAFSGLCLYVMARAGVRISETGPATPAGIAAFMLSFALFINLSLILFNLIPLFPLDGHHVVRELLPWNKRAEYMHWQVRFGQFILLALVGVPWLMRSVLKKQVTSPLDYYMGLIEGVILHCLPNEALGLFADAWDRYRQFLSW